VAAFCINQEDANKRPKNFSVATHARVEMQALPIDRNECAMLTEFDQSTLANMTACKRLPAEEIIRIRELAGC